MRKMSYALIGLGIFLFLLLGFSIAYWQILGEMRGLILFVLVLGFMVFHLGFFLRGVIRRFQEKETDMLDLVI